MVKEGDADMQNADYEWFLEHCSELFNKFGNTYLAIKNKTVLGAYSTYAEGVKTTLKTEQIGTFIVQLCGSDESAYTNYISSMNFCL